MRIRLRAPGGNSVITLADDNATVGDLLNAITTETSVANFDLRYGYPPKPLPLDQSQRSKLLKDLDVKLSGEQLILSVKEEYVPIPKEAVKEKEPGPIALKKKDKSKDVPEVAFPERHAQVVLRVMPDDNSCLFRAFGTAIGMDYLSPPELRSIVASAVQADPDTYSEVVLERKPDDYCTWIQTEDAWGGFIELSILAQHFDIEICSIDIKALRIDKYKEGAANRCILVYSGIHYDTIVQTPLYGSPDQDLRIWESTDDEIISKALELCSILQKKNYYTDTGSMVIKCNICGTTTNGEAQAQIHAQQSGHYDMQQIS